MDRQTDGRTDRFAISISHVSMQTRDKKNYVKSTEKLIKFMKFHGKYPTSIPNLKLLASAVAEINRGSHIFTRSPSQDPH